MTIPTRNNSIRPNILAMQGYVPGEQPQAGKYIKLNTNENPYPPSERVRTAVLEALERGLQRYPDPLATSFRLAASEVLGVPPDWILCGNGSDDILTIVTRTMVGEGELLRMPYPSYVLYHNLAELQGARFQEIPFARDWNLELDHYAAAAEGLKLAVVPNPNSPSGTFLSPDTLSAAAQRLPCPLLIDEAYVDFAEENCLALVARHPNVLVSRTLSKSYSLAGLRFGFVVAQPAMIEQLAKVKDSYNCDALSIAAATAAIRDQHWLQENRRRILAGRDWLHTQLSNLGFQIVPSQANFLWCTFQNRPLQPLYEQLKQRQVLVRYMRYTNWPEGLRISVGTPEQNEVLIQLLQELLSDSNP